MATGKPSYGNGYVVCKGCRYRWNWRRNPTCFNCGKPLSPQVRDAPEPQGVWADKKGQKGGPQKGGHGGRKGGKGGAGGRGESSNLDGAPWRLPPDRLQNLLDSCGDPDLQQALLGAVAAVEKAKNAPPAPPPRTSAQVLQSAVDKRVHAQKQLETATEWMVAAEEQLAEARTWQVEKAMALATAQKEEELALLGRAAETGVSPKPPPGANEVTFDFSLPEDLHSLEEEAQETLRAMSVEGKRVMEQALASYEAQVKSQKERVEKAIHEARSKKRRIDEQAQAEGQPSGVPQAEPAAAAPAAKAEADDADLRRKAEQLAAAATKATKEAQAALAASKSEGAAAPSAAAASGQAQAVPGAGSQL